MIDFWWSLTDFGDSAVTLPLGLAITLTLLAGRRYRAAALWIGCIAFTAGATGSTKLLMKTCGGPLVGTVLVAPSGHTAMSMTIYGGLALLAGRHLADWRGRLAFLAAMALALAIAVSRVIIGAHTVPEVAVGLAIGGVALAALHLLLPREDPFVLPLVWLSGALVAVMAASYGDRWPIEDLLREMAFILRGHLPACG